jgi:DNA-binding NarL/FixJ family response regulator
MGEPLFRDALRSNRDIARALTVEVKTVEAHLTRIFAKVGASSVFAPTL